MILRLLVALILLVVSSVQAARDFPGTGNFLNTGSAVVGGTRPFTVCAWFNSDADADQPVVDIAASANNANAYGIWTNGVGAGNPIFFYARQTASSTAVTSTGYTVGSWHVMCGIEISATSRWAYIGGGSGVQNTTSRTPTGLNRTRIAERAALSDVAAYDGRVAWVAAWTVELNTWEISMMATRANPCRIRRQSLVTCAPLWGTHSPEVDIGAMRTWSITGSPTLHIGAPAAPFFRP